MPYRMLVAALAATLGVSMTDALAASIDVVEASIADLQAAMSNGSLTARELTAKYLERIRTVDKAGPKLNAVIAVNPDALAIAAALDEERRQKGPRGPLHGIPVVLKDNIATGDRMPTTAGSLALEGVRAAKDAFIVARLREAGAVILGKANLSEWANFRSTRSTSGWSSLGGLTRNPYALDRNPGGSSSGSAVAAAASLATVAVGTETDGSIVSPSSANGIVGIKPTLGLASRSGIIPIAPSQDTPGPMARTVRDAAILLTALAGSDPRDEATAEAGAKATDYTKALDENALRGARIGVVRSHMKGGGKELVAGEIEKALEVMKRQGAILVDVPELPNAGRYGDTELEVLLHEIKAAMPRYLAEYAPTARVKTLADILRFNEENKSKVMPFFGQENFVAAEERGGLESDVYRRALEQSRRLAREAIDKVLQDNRLDAIVAPSGPLPWLTDFIRGDFAGSAFSQAPAVAGYPHVTVPAGYLKELPFGISFVGTAWSEAKLIGLAYAFEQATRHRRPPRFPSTVNTWMGD